MLINKNRTGGLIPVPAQLTWAGEPSKVLLDEVTHSLGRSTWVGYFRLSMYVSSATRKVPNARKDMIVWKVSIGRTSFPEGANTTSWVVQPILYDEHSRNRGVFFLFQCGLFVISFNLTLTFVANI